MEISWQANIWVGLGCKILISLRFLFPAHIHTKSFLFIGASWKIKLQIIKKNKMSVRSLFPLFLLFLEGIVSCSFVTKVRKIISPWHINPSQVACSWLESNYGVQLSGWAGSFSYGTCPRRQEAGHTLTHSDTYNQFIYNVLSLPLKNAGFIYLSVLDVNSQMTLRTLSLQSSSTGPNWPNSGGAPEKGIYLDSATKSICSAIYRSFIKIQWVQLAIERLFDDDCHIILLCVNLHDTHCMTVCRNGFSV